MTEECRKMQSPLTLTPRTFSCKEQSRSTQMLYLQWLKLTVIIMEMEHIYLHPLESVKTKAKE